MAGKDDDLLRNLLSGIETDSDALRSMFDDLVAPDPAAGLTDPDDVPEPPEDPVTKLGDLWILGDHRLLCGDSSSTEDVDRLLNGAPIHLVNTDPPYNVKVEPRSNNAIAAGNSSFRKPAGGANVSRMRAKDRPLENDFVSDAEFDGLLRAWFNNAANALEPGRGFYIWGGYSNVSNYPAAIAEAGLARRRSWWAKGSRKKTTASCRWTSARGSGREREKR